MCENPRGRASHKLLILEALKSVGRWTKTTAFLHPLYGVDDIRFESLPPPEIPVLFATAFTERLTTVDGEREGATRVRQGEPRLFDLNAACLVGFAIPE